MVDWRIVSMSYFVDRTKTDSHCSAVNGGVIIGSLCSPSVSRCRKWVARSARTLDRKCRGVDKNRLDHPLVRE